MDRLMKHFRDTHLVIITERAAGRLAGTVRAMRALDGGLRLGVTGSDVSALTPRRVDVTLDELRDALEGRRSSVA
jgi:hypothetical protein